MSDEGKKAKGSLFRNINWTGEGVLTVKISYRVHSISVVSPASLLDSQHGCIASPHAKKESGQTPLAVWACTVSKCGCTVSKDE